MNFAGQFSPYPSATGDDAQPSAVSSLRQLRDFFVREGWLIGVVTGLSIALGGIYVMTSPYRYTAHADMIIDTKRVSQNETSSDYRPVDDSSIESEMETTKSEKVAIAVIRRLHLTDDPEFAESSPGLRQRLLSFLKLGTEQPADSSEEKSIRSALRVLQANLRVTRLGRSYVEQISYTASKPDKAAAIANAFADAYIEDQLQAKFDATRRASVWLEQRIGELRKQASDAYRAVQDFKSQNSIIIGVDGKLASEVELDQLGIALAKARADTSQARARLDRISRVLEQRPNNKSNLKIPDPVVTDALSSPVITRLRQQFLDDQNKESEWSARYGPDHQAVKNLRGEMAALQQAIWDEVSRIGESYKSELQITKSQEEAIDKRIVDVFNKSSSTRQSQVHLRELETSANTYRGIYETFLTRFTQSVQQQSFPSTEARVVTPASPPSEHSSPKTTLTIALAAICGLAFGIMGAFGRQQMNRQIHTRADLEKLLGLTCLAVLPSVFEKRRRRADARTTQRVAGGQSAVPQSMQAQGSLEARKGTAFHTLSDSPPFSATAEALRYIKVAIDLNSRAPKIIGVISALPGEGKTTVSIGLAGFLAKSGERTLLIDADLRNPSMTRSLGYANAPNLLDLVADETSLASVVINDPQLKFDFLPAATRIKTQNSVDILNSAFVKETLGKARDVYDYILVDLPPVLPVVDVKATAQLFDAFIMVVEWGQTSTDEIVKAVEASSILSERLLGTVLNKADEAVMRRYEGRSDRSFEYYTNERSVEPTP